MGKFTLVNSMQLKMAQKRVRDRDLPTVLSEIEMYICEQDGRVTNTNEWWLSFDKDTKEGRWILIETMDFSHLENIVNYFSNPKIKVDPQRQEAFERVMLTYLVRKGAEDEKLDKALQLMENIDERN